MNAKPPIPDRGQPPQDAGEPKEEQDLDAALADSFPASDPVSSVFTGVPTAPPRDEEIDRDKEADKRKTD